MSEIISVPIGAIDANPFRLTSKYPYVERNRKPDTVLR